jgi:phosphohistidine phosphatase
MRHAKSSWRDPALDDHDRPLAGRGRRAAKYIAKLLETEKLIPQFMLASTAQRAVETANWLVEEGGYDGPLELTRRLYLAEPAVYADLLTEVPPGTELALIVGHNPGISELVSQLTGEYIDMPTAAVARIELPVEELADVTIQTEGKLAQFYRPPKEEKRREKKRQKRG